MTTLQTRLAQADKPSRELLGEVYQAVNGGRLFLDPGSGGFQQSYARFLRYQHMLDAEAWTSAVEMLVPEGYGFSVHSPCQVIPDNLPSVRIWGALQHTIEAEASTPALALAIACLKARGL